MLRTGGSKIREKQLKIADLVVDIELDKMMNLIHLAPKFKLRERKRTLIWSDVLGSRQAEEEA